MIRTHVAISLDGFVADAAGLPAWDAQPTFGAGTHGTDDLAGVDAVVVGRTSFDQGFADWLEMGWPWPGRQVYVLTSTPLPTEVPSGVTAVPGGPAALVERLRRDGADRDVHVLGGSRTIQALLELGALDRLGIVLLPVLLGTGIPLFAGRPTAFSPRAWAASRSPGGPGGEISGGRLRRLTLTDQRVFPDGAVQLHYATG